MADWKRLKEEAAAKEAERIAKSYIGDYGAGGDYGPSTPSPAPSAPSVQPLNVMDVGGSSFGDLNQVAPSQDKTQQNIDFMKRFEKHQQYEADQRSQKREQYYQQNPAARIGVGALAGAGSGVLPALQHAGDSLAATPPGMAVLYGANKLLGSKNEGTFGDEVAALKTFAKPFANLIPKIPTGQEMRLQGPITEPETLQGSRMSMAGERLKTAFDPQASTGERVVSGGLGALDVLSLFAGGPKSMSTIPGTNIAPVHDAISGVVKLPGRAAEYAAKIGAPNPTLNPRGLAEYWKDLGRPGILPPGMNLPGLNKPKPRIDEALDKKIARLASIELEKVPDHWQAADKEDFAQNLYYGGVMVGKEAVDMPEAELAAAMKAFAMQQQKALGRRTMTMEPSQVPEPSGPLSESAPAVTRAPSASRLDTTADMDARMKRVMDGIKEGKDVDGIMADAEGLIADKDYLGAVAKSLGVPNHRNKPKWLEGIREKLNERALEPTQSRATPAGRQEAKELELAKQASQVAEEGPKPWRIAHDASEDEFHRNDILRAIAIRTRNPQTLDEVLSLGGDSPYHSNLYWDIAHNPAAPEATKTKAMARYNEVLYERPEALAKQADEIAEAPTPLSEVQPLITPITESAKTGGDPTFYIKDSELVSAVGDLNWKGVTEADRSLVYKLSRRLAAEPAKLDNALKEVGLNPSDYPRAARSEVLSNFFESQISRSAGKDPSFWDKRIESAKVKKDPTPSQQVQPLRMGDEGAQATSAPTQAADPISAHAGSPAGQSQAGLTPSQTPPARTRPEIPKAPPHPGMPQRQAEPSTAPQYDASQWREVEYRTPSGAVVKRMERVVNERAQTAAERAAAAREVAAARIAASRERAAQSAETVSAEPPMDLPPPDQPPPLPNKPPALPDEPGLPSGPDRNQTGFPMGNLDALENAATRTGNQAGRALAEGLRNAIHEGSSAAAEPVHRINQLGEKVSKYPDAAAEVHELFTPAAYERVGNGKVLFSRFQANVDSNATLMHITEEERILKTAEAREYADAAVDELAKIGKAAEDAGVRTGDGREFISRQGQVFTQRIDPTAREWMVNGNEDFEDLKRIINYYHPKVSVEEIGKTLQEMANSPLDRPAAYEHKRFIPMMPAAYMSRNGQVRRILNFEVIPTGPRTANPLSSLIQSQHMRLAGIKNVGQDLGETMFASPGKISGEVAGLESTPLGAALASSNDPHLVASARKAIAGYYHQPEAGYFKTRPAEWWINTSNDLVAQSIRAVGKIIVPALNLSMQGLKSVPQVFGRVPAMVGVRNFMKSIPEIAFNYAKTSEDAVKAGALTQQFIIDAARVWDKYRPFESAAEFLTSPIKKLNDVIKDLEDTWAFSAARFKGDDMLANGAKQHDFLAMDEWNVPQKVQDVFRNPSAYDDAAKKDAINGYARHVVWYSQHHGKNKALKGRYENDPMLGLGLVYASYGINELKLTVKSLERLNAAMRTGVDPNANAAMKVLQRLNPAGTSQSRNAVKKILTGLAGAQISGEWVADLSSAAQGKDPFRKDRTLIGRLFENLSYVGLLGPAHFLLDQFLARSGLLSEDKELAKSMGAGRSGARVPTLSNPLIEGATKAVTKAAQGDIGGAAWALTGGQAPLISGAARVTGIMEPSGTKKTTSSGKQSAYDRIYGGKKTKSSVDRIYQNGPKPKKSPYERIYGK